MPRVCVIIPTYNRRQWVFHAIESVLHQTFGDYNLIVIDDASTDDTGKALEKYQNHCTILQNPKNLGVSASRNKGIMTTDSEWVAFLDSDDRWRPQKLKQQIDMVDQSPDIQVSFTDEIWIRRGVRVNPKKKHQKRDGWIFQPSLSLCLMAPSTIMIRRDVFEAVGLFDETLPVCEDYDLWLKITSQFPVHLLNEKLMVRYGGHEDQLSSRSWGNDRFRIQSLQNILQTMPLKEADRKAAIQKLVEKCKILIHGFEKRQNWEQAAYYQKILKQYHEK